LEDNMTMGAGTLTKLVTDLCRLLADRLGAQAFTTVHAICGRNFMDAITAHPEVREAYLAIPMASRLMDPNWMRQVPFREMIFEEYRGRVGPVQFVDDDYAFVFAEGVPDLFVEAYAPADYIETVNTIALPRYAKQEVIPFGKGIMFETQQNVLPICTMPDTLLTLRATEYVVP